LIVVVWLGGRLIWTPTLGHVCTKKDLTAMSKGLIAVPVIGNAPSKPRGSAALPSHTDRGDLAQRIPTLCAHLRGPKGLIRHRWTSLRHDFAGTSYVLRTCAIMYPFSKLAIKHRLD
jgi:hypothetical protein